MGVRQTIVGNETPPSERRARQRGEAGARKRTRESGKQVDWRTEKKGGRTPWRPLSCTLSSISLSLARSLALPVSLRTYGQLVKTPGKQPETSTCPDACCLLLVKRGLVLWRPTFTTLNCCSAVSLSYTLIGALYSSPITVYKHYSLLLCCCPVAERRNVGTRNSYSSSVLISNRFSTPNSNLAGSYWLGCTSSPASSGGAITTRYNVQPTSVPCAGRCEPAGSG